jgi:hypothetical protein
VIGFLQPLALLGLVLVAIPPLLHLLGRRRPPVVIFPAIQYLTKTEQEHSHRLKLRNLLLLLLRMAVIVFVVLAASRPVLRRAGGPDHPPTAMAIVLDNSLSSGAVIEGDRVLDHLREQAQRLLDQATADDRLWLLLADGVPQRMSRAVASALLDSVTPWPERGDLGDAVRSAASVLEQSELTAREIVVLSDLQATAFSSGMRTAIPVLVATAPAVPANLGIDSALADPPVWSPGGIVVSFLGGSSDRHSAVRVSVDGVEIGRAVATARDRVPIVAELLQRGWFAAAVDLDPDELRADDRWWLALKVTEPAAVRVGVGAGPFVTAAFSVLEQGGRVRPGNDVTIADRLGPGRSILLPPAEPSLVGATNRALAARGLSVRFGDLLDGEWGLAGDIGVLRDVSVFRRYRVEGGETVLASAGAEPWLVRDNDVVVVGSRLEASWSDLPVGAPFVPFLDFLVNRVAAEQIWVVRATPGSIVFVPRVGNRVVFPDGALELASDGRVAVPRAPGVYFVLDAGGDTVGALEVNHDPRESALVPASAAQIRGALGTAARVVGEGALAREVFGGARRAELTGSLLVLALVAGVMELLVASFLGASRRE